MWGIVLSLRIPYLLVSVASQNYWIGARSFNSTHKTFLWSSGHGLNYTYWGGGDEVDSIQQPEPDTSQQCVYSNGLDHYMWHDDNCAARHFFICERLDPDFTVHVTTPSTLGKYKYEQTSTIYVKQYLFIISYIIVTVTSSLCMQYLFFLNEYWCSWSFIQT